MATSGHRRNWADMQMDLVCLILEKLILLRDYIRFGAVCKAWHSATVDNHQSRRRTGCQQPPLLLLQPAVLDVDNRYFYNILDHRTYSQPLAIPYTNLYSKKCCGSSYGWFAVTYVKDWSITLFNPFSGKTLQLPSISPNDGSKWSSKICRFALSCDPGLNPNDWVGIAIYSLERRLAIIRAGQDSWYNLRYPTRQVIAAGLCKGYLYVMNVGLELLRMGIYDDFELVKKVKPLIGVDFIRYKFHFVELEGELLLVCRHYINDTFGKPRKRKLETKDEDAARTVGFRVYKLHLKGQQSSAFDSDDELGEWVEIQDLGEFCLFLGENQPICISTATFRDCQPNCIYFTADTSSINHFIPYNAADMGVFDLATCQISQFYIGLPPQLSRRSAAIWISPSLG